MQDDLAGCLGTFDCCTLSDALDKIGRAGVVTGLMATLPGRRIAGRIHTVKLAAGAAPSATPARHLGAAAIDAAAAGEVIVIEQSTGVEAGSWGGILSHAAHLKGIAGVISEGLVRDIDEARELDLPIFCRGFTALTARARIHEQATDEPIRISGITVEPGWYVVADSSAAVFIAPGDVERVIDAAADIATRETEIVRRLKAGESASNALAANYERMLSRED